MSCSEWGCRTLSEFPVPGVVHVVLPVVVDEAVVRLVVDPLEAQRRTEVVPLGRVVVDDIEDDFDPGVVQRPHHALELLHLLAELTGGRVSVVRREEPDRVVAPVVAEALVEQRVVVHELVHGHQLDGGDTDALVVLDHRRMGEGGVRAARVLRDVRVELRETLDVRLVDHRLGVRDARMTVAGPVEERVDDDTEHHVRGGVVVVDRCRIAELVREQRRIPVDLADRRLGVRVEQQLVRVRPLALGRVVRTVDAIAVALAGLHLGQVAVPDVGVDVLQLDARLDPVLVEEAQLHSLRRLAEQREVRAAAIECRAQRVRRSRPRLHVSPVPRRGVPEFAERCRASARVSRRRSRRR